MSRRAMSARISADVYLQQITVKLAADRDPVVELHGTLDAANRSAGMTSKVTITTAWLGPLAAQFVKEAKQAFGSAALARRESSSKEQVS